MSRLAAGKVASVRRISHRAEAQCVHAVTVHDSFAESSMGLCLSDANALCVQRTYDFIEVCGWFAARCDLILLLFDPAKLDISDEMKQVCALSPPTVLIPKACKPFMLPSVTPDLARKRVLLSA